MPNEAYSNYPPDVNLQEIGVEPYPEEDDFQEQEEEEDE